MYGALLVISIKDFIYFFAGPPRFAEQGFPSPFQCQHRRVMRGYSRLNTDTQVASAPSIVLYTDNLLFSHRSPFSCQPRSRPIVRTNAHFLVLSIHVIIPALLRLAKCSDRDVCKPNNSRDNTVSDILATTCVSREQQPKPAIYDAKRNKQTTEP